MSVNYTSIEQSKKLLELGLSPESADMIHICSIIRGKENGFLDVVPKESILYAMHTTIEEKEKSIPCWSLGALLELIPIITKKLSHPPSLTKALDGSGYFIEYPCYPNLPIYVDKNPIKVAYKAIVWLLENGYIKTK